MGQGSGQSSIRAGSMDKDTTIEHVKSTDGETLEQNILNRYDLLKTKSQEELDALNKKVVKKLDWKFLLCITIMLLMK